MAGQLIKYPKSDVILPAIEIANGDVSGYSTQRKFGFNADIGGAYEPVWDAGGAYGGFLTGSITVRVKAGGHPTDGVTGSGARYVCVCGLDENGNTASETIALSGAIASPATTTTFKRISRSYVTDVGTYGSSNTGDVIIETIGGVEMARSLAGMGQTQMAIWTIPAGYKANLVSVHLTVNTNKDMSARIWQRENILDTTPPVSANRLVSQFIGISDTSLHDYHVLPSFPPLTDIWVEALSTSTDKPLSVELDFYLKAL